MNSNSRITLLQNIYDIYDTFVRELNVACHKGCSTCCTRNVTLNSLEGEKILRYLGAMNSQQWRTSLLEAKGKSRFHPQVTINQLAELCVRNQEIPEEMIGPQDSKCPLLVDGLCTIYPVRPFGCRAMISKEVCDATGMADMPDFVLTVNNVFLQYIEAIDYQGFSGNLVDVLIQLSSDRRRTDIRNLSRLPQHLLPNHPLTVLMVPPEHRQRMQPLIEAIKAAISFLS